MTTSNRRPKASCIAVLRTISHEVRTPLTAIIGFAELIQQCDPEDASAYAGIISKRGQELVDTLEKVMALLDASNLEDVLDEPIGASAAAREAVDVPAEPVWIRPKSVIEAEADFVPASPPGSGASDPVAVEVEVDVNALEDVEMQIPPAPLASIVRTSLDGLMKSAHLFYARGAVTRSRIQIASHLSAGHLHLSIDLKTDGEVPDFSLSEAATLEVALVKRLVHRMGGTVRASVPATGPVRASLRIVLPETRRTPRPRLYRVSLPSGRPVRSGVDPSS